MAMKSFILDPNHVHQYIIVKDVEIIKIEVSKLETVLGTSVIKESIKTGKPE